jgi:hypothetical protein
MEAMTMTKTTYKGVTLENVGLSWYAIRADGSWTQIGMSLAAAKRAINDGLPKYGWMPETRRWA